MWDRTLTISSAGKTFSATGWQVGWVVGPRRLVRDVQTLLPCVCDDDVMTIYDDVSTFLPCVSVPRIVVVSSSASSARAASSSSDRGRRGARTAR